MKHTNTHTHLEVPVHYVMLVGVRHTVQNLMDTVTVETKRQGEEQIKGGTQSKETQHQHLTAGGRLQKRVRKIVQPDHQNEHIFLKDFPNTMETQLLTTSSVSAVGIGCCMSSGTSQQSHIHSYASRRGYHTRCHLFIKCNSGEQSRTNGSATRGNLGFSILQEDTEIDILQGPRAAASPPELNLLN